MILKKGFMKKSIFVFFLLLLMKGVVLSSEDTDLAALKRRLVLLEADIEKLEEESARLQDDYLKFEHDIAYSNETTKAIYMEIKQLEKQLNEKRKLLADELQKEPFFREIGKKRAEVFNKLSRLRQEAIITRQEIKRLEGTVVDDKKNASKQK